MSTGLLDNYGLKNEFFNRDDANHLLVTIQHRQQIMNMGTLLLTEAFYRQEKTISAELIFSCDQIEISE